MTRAMRATTKQGEEEDLWVCTWLLLLLSSMLVGLQARQVRYISVSTVSETAVAAQLDEAVTDGEVGCARRASHRRQCPGEGLVACGLDEHQATR